ncbi:MAG: CPBP family intramembrane metalloprotease [Solobacterium sp.]|nr:CPBP family intramembrane metalloprotease [Solobacterium sp.]
MKEFGKKHPILMSVLVFFAGLFLALILSLPFIVTGTSSELGLAVSRIGAGIILFFVFRYCFQGMKAFTSFPYALPAFLFGVWNLVYNPMIGNPFAALGIETVILALAPAVFEEVIFRGISIWFLKEKGYSMQSVMLISAAVFGAVHLTNIAGMTVLNVLVQTGYAFVVGLVLASLVLTKKDFGMAMLVHFFTDFTSHLFVPQTNAAPVTVLILFVVLLAAEAAFAFWLIRKK